MSTSREYKIAPTAAKSPLLTHIPYQNIDQWYAQWGTLSAFLQKSSKICLYQDYNFSHISPWT